MQLAVYYVMTEPGVSLDHLKDEDARNIKFVKDGFSWWAMLFPLLWSLYNRMWLVFLGYLAAIIALVFIAEAFGSTTGGFITVLATLFFAMEAGFLKSWSLRRKNWQTVGFITAANLDEAEIRFFDRVSKTKSEVWLPQGPMAPQTSDTDVVGMTLKR
ncbi:DUF2628 domain-containing protein [Pseudovibrio sp. WM33]|uniref:DUF2628 domain-containing protein n=1 Tax=Pseudovibrio sp. WM33 TaxID=1735585 RepID=UPI0007AEE401|nr:DUF2628 domain-containing protein [Pseudovibrio sp. WM33]